MKASENGEPVKARSGKKGKDKEWLMYEEAVASFLKALSDEAIVTHNVMLPDSDTGRPRQRDVWIEAKVLGTFEVRILVSCKLWGRRVSSKDIDAFIGELASSGAQKGVIYASGGFSGPALEKAKVRGISCCKLCRGQPAEIPEVLTITYYYCRPMGQLVSRSAGVGGMGVKTFQELFDEEMGIEPGSSRLLDKVVEAYNSGMEESLVAAREAHGLPKPWSTTLSLETEGSGGSKGALTIEVRGQFKIWKSRIEGHEVEGTYNFTEKRFVGTERSPWINMWGQEPGPEWEAVLELPEEIEGAFGVIAMPADARAAFRKVLAGDVNEERAGEIGTRNGNKGL